MPWAVSLSWTVRYHTSSSASGGAARKSKTTETSSPETSRPPGIINTLERPATAVMTEKHFATRTGLLSDQHMRNCWKSLPRKSQKEQDAQEEREQGTDSQQKVPGLPRSSNTPWDEVLAYFLTYANVLPCLICTLYDLPLPLLLLVNHKEYTREIPRIKISVILVSEATKKNALHVNHFWSLVIVFQWKLMMAW